MIEKIYRSKLFLIDLLIKIKYEFDYHINRKYKFDMIILINWKNMFLINYNHLFISIVET